MNGIIEELSKPLNKEDIELRTGVCTQSGFSLLLFKTARTDINRLNRVCGLDWKNEHFYDKDGNLACRISIYDKEKKEWVSREDIGVESSTEKEKGSYSDSFKRAGFRFGIGIELYTAPFIWISGNTEKNDKGKFNPTIKVQEIEVSDYLVENNRIKYLVLSYKGKIIYSNKQKMKEQETLVTAEQIDELEKLGVNFDQLAKYYKVADYKNLTAEQAKKAIEQKKKINKEITL